MLHCVIIISNELCVFSVFYTRIENKPINWWIFFTIKSYLWQFCVHIVLVNQIDLFLKKTAKVGATAPPKLNKLLLYSPYSTFYNQHINN